MGTFFPGARKSCSNIMGDVAREMGWGPILEILNAGPRAVGHYFLCSSDYWLGSAGKARMTRRLSWQHLQDGQGAWGKTPATDRASCSWSRGLEMG